MKCILHYVTYGKPLMNVSFSANIDLHIVAVQGKSCAAGELRIEHGSSFLGRSISKGANDMKFSADIGDNPSRPHTHRNQTIDVHKPGNV